MRGKLHFSFTYHFIDRITPADAGKTITNFFLCLHNRDHPRGCGENLNVCKNTAQGTGSPPRMRGKLEEESNAYRYKRITPADAGKTRCAAGIIIKYEDHPRGCGENTEKDETLFALLGSPPRMRGKPEQYCKTLLHQGITPADAGKTQNRNNKQD